MNDTLKVAGRIGAELGAAKTENEKLRKALKRIIDRCEAFVDDEAEMRTPSVEVLMGIAEDAIYTVHEADVALSQQPEPTDTYTAVDMATAAAQGFRDGQAAVEQDTAQDERWAVHAQGPDELYAAFSREDAEQHAAALNTLSMPAGIQVSAIVVESPWPAAEHWKYLAEQERDHVAELRARVTHPRPAQTEQQPCEAEEWRSVDGYEGLYSVSSLGRLRSDRTGKYLSLNSRVASGYVKADMHKDGEKKQTTVHRLVAQAFLERPEGADEVNHINGDKLDNRVSNLAWCSRRENVNHGYYELGHLVHRVKAIPIEGNGPELVFASIEQAVANGFHSGGIYTCLGQPHRYHLGYYWRSLKDAAPIAQTAPQPEQSTTVRVPISVIEEAAHMLEAHSPGSGSVESFVAQDLRAALSAQGGEA